MNDLTDLKPLARDAEGYLIDPLDWCETVAEVLATEGPSMQNGTNPKVGAVYRQ